MLYYHCNIVLLLELYKINIQKQTGKWRGYNSEELNALLLYIYIVLMVILSTHVTCPFCWNLLRQRVSKIWEIQKKGQNEEEWQSC